MRTRDEIVDSARRDGVVLRRDHPHAADTLARMVRQGQLTRVLSGVYCLPGAEADPRIRMAAVAARWPDAVFTRAAAASLSFWPEVPVPLVTASLPHRGRPGAGVRLDRQHVPADLTLRRHGLLITTPALTALSMSTEQQTEPIDRVLRVGAVTLPQLWETLDLVPGRAGNVVRRMLLADSRDLPWSHAERLCHRVLRAAGITGWQANLPVRDSYGALRRLDVGFRRERLALEIDGRFHDRDRGTFESDRSRQNALILAGWSMLRFTVLQVTTEQQRVVAEVRSALAIARRRRV